MKTKSEESFIDRVKYQLRRVFGIFSDVRFWFTLIVFVYVVLTGHDLLEMSYTKREWWDKFYSILSALLVGGLISFLFYFLVVLVPERKRRQIIKANLIVFYASIKRDILYQVIFASQKGGRTDLEADNETVEQLLTIDGFKAAFEGGKEGHEGYYAFRNHLSDDVPEYREIILNLQILSKQIDYILHNYPITDPIIFNFFKRLEIFLMRMEKLGPGYDEEKILFSFIWEIFTGWDWIDGYRGYDLVEKMIRDI